MLGYDPAIVADHNRTGLGMNLPAVRPCPGRHRVLIDVEAHQPNLSAMMSAIFRCARRRPTSAINWINAHGRWLGNRESFPTRKQPILLSSQLRAHGPVAEKVWLLAKAGSVFNQRREYQA